MQKTQNSLPCHIMNPRGASLMFQNQGTSGPIKFCLQNKIGLSEKKTNFANNKKKVHKSS